MGGAERVAVELARTFDAPIYAMRVDSDVPPDDIDVIDIASRLGSWLMKRHYLIQDAYQFLAWQHVEELYDYETVILTKNNPSWFVPHADSQTVIKYTHSTPRNLYDQFHRRGGDILTNGLMTLQRLLYQLNTSYPDHWIANSEIVRRRVKMYADPAAAGIDVVYPPVETAQTSPQTANTQDYLFSIGRLAVNKRVDLLLDVARHTDMPVVIAGDGGYREQVEQASIPNLTYLGRISEGEKWRRFSEAKATLMLAENEDFGIVPIESMAAGTPVIGADEGYTKHQIKDGGNGYTVTPTVAAVTDAINRLDGLMWSPDEIAAFAEQFSAERFRHDIQEIIAAVQSQTEVTPDHERPTRPESRLRN